MTAVATDAFCGGVKRRNDGGGDTYLMIMMSAGSKVTESSPLCLSVMLFI